MLFRLAALRRLSSAFPRCASPFRRVAIHALSFAIPLLFVAGRSRVLLIRGQSFRRNAVPLLCPSRQLASIALPRCASPFRRVAIHAMRFHSFAFRGWSILRPADPRHVISRHCLCCAAPLLCPSGHRSSTAPQSSALLFPCLALLFPCASPPRCSYAILIKTWLFLSSASQCHSLAVLFSALPRLFVYMQFLFPALHRFSFAVLNGAIPLLCSSRLCVRGHSVAVLHVAIT